MSKKIEKLYSRQAKRYDWTEKIYRLFGFREEKYRRAVIAVLDLQEGDTVIDLGCGTGKNFEQILQKIGRTGILIGVDLTAAMLAQAQKRIDKNDWQNVTLVHTDVADYEFPVQFPADGILSTFALSFSADYAQVIQRSAAALAEKSGTFAVADMCWSDNLPRWLMWIGTKFAAPFGVSETSLRRDLLGEIGRNFPQTEQTLYYFDTVFVAAGINL
jgi:demethylmenaquinone methyltransferase/2-methoxy-6-polyprenyl-1,4-benzoquinol methylase